VEDAPAPVVATSAGPARVEEGAVAVGSAAAERLRGRASIAVQGESLRIAAILPATATVDDTALFVSPVTIDRLGAPGSPSELRMFLSPGANIRSASHRLSAALPDAQVIRTDRGDVADGEMDRALARHRVAVYLVAAAVAALCLAIAAHLDASERRTELATLVAVGATRTTLAQMVVARSALIAAAGGAAGAAFAFLLAAALDAFPSTVIARALGAAASVPCGAVFVALFAALPTAIAAAARDPVADLQEG
jgi:predicted lysophospholipase L1 biosynthesis ABC-type transport system permease subunit